ncbi:MAG TPA: hypothetical protein VHU17_21925, partial [Acidimicrobiales bacterium]|nr:hypothetical protein [Acidimicrobiales bacterium]
MRAISRTAAKARATGASHPRATVVDPRLGFARRAVGWGCQAGSLAGELHELSVRGLGDHGAGPADHDRTVEPDASVDAPPALRTSKPCVGQR